MADRIGAHATTQLTSGQEALRRGDWTAARAAFEQCVTLDDPSPEAWDGLGAACYWLQDAERMFQARQEAYRGYRESRQRAPAARVAAQIASDYLEFRAETAVAEGWLERGRQLVEGLPPTAESAFLKEIEAHFTLAVRGDPVGAGALAREAAEIARAAGDTDHEMMAQAMEGLALVVGGSVPTGMRRLDAAAAAALGGDMVDLTAISVTCCYVIQACERVRDVERAAVWCTRFQELCARWHLGTFLTFCRLQHGTVLLWRGEWEAAEAELLAAQRDLEQVRPAARAAVLVRLGELRRRQGRWEEAASLLEAARTHRLAPFRRAALALDQNDPLTAEELADQALRRTATTDAERVTALELLVRARAARGRPVEAREALAQLETAAAEIGTEPVRASAFFAHGVLARATGDDQRARKHFRDAADLFEAGNAPYEAAAAALELARTLVAGGRAESAATPARRALELFDRLGAARGTEQAKRLMRELALTDRAQSATKSLTRRQAEVLRLVAQGLSSREVGERLGLSEFTVRRHLANIFTRLGVSSRAAAVAHALREGLL